MTEALCYRQSLGEATARGIKFVRQESKLERRDSDIEEVSWSEIQELDLIGAGAFSRVYKVRWHHESGISTNYALKRLNLDTMSESSGHRKMMDLGVEGELLSRLRHENIVRLYGVCSGDPIRAFTDDKRGYFLLIDLLQETLRTRLENYRRKRQQSYFAKKLTSPSEVRKRLASCALGVAEGMEYLHKNGVILRDLKPENIGFDEKGTPKIFDFGFAREVHTVDNEVTGTLRYLAPEVAMMRGTKLSADVYSFGIILWELCTLECPFHQYSNQETARKFFDDVVIKGARPSVSSIESLPLRRLIKSCWFSNPVVRPSFTQVIKSLNKEISLDRLKHSNSSDLRLKFRRKMGTWGRRMFSKSTSDLSEIQPKDIDDDATEHTATDYTNTSDGDMVPIRRNSFSN